jgi:polyphenol oxidase
VAPAAFACTTWGTPSVDIGAAVISQLAAAGCTVHDVAVCTRESADLYSNRRDGASAGRFGGIVVRRGTVHE